MTSSPALAPAPKCLLEGPLSYLPCSTVIAFGKGQVIYNQEHPSTSIYLVIAGTVKVSRIAGDGREVLMDIYQTDEFFGEISFLNHPLPSDVATALENTKVMTWTTIEIEEIIMRRPRLAVALLQILAQRTMDFRNRIESFAGDNITCRLARSLIRFSERLGIQEDNGSVRMIPLSHELLSQYVGTSREIVSLYMSQFSRQGYLKYSRQGITLHRDAFRAWLNQSAGQDHSKEQVGVC